MDKPIVEKAEDVRKEIPGMSLPFVCRDSMKKFYVHRGSIDSWTYPSLLFLTIQVN